MERSNAKCKKVLESGKNKGRSCKNNATGNGFCKMHSDNSSNSVASSAFSSDKVGLERYIELESYLNSRTRDDSEPGNLAQTNAPVQEAPRIASEIPAQKKKKQKVARPPQEEYEEPGTLAPRKESRKRAFYDDFSDQDDDGDSHMDDMNGTRMVAMPSSKKKNKRKKARKGSNKDAGTNMDIEDEYVAMTCLMGAETISDLVETTNPSKFRGLTEALMTNRMWRESFITVCKEKIRNNPDILSPEKALLFSTAMIVVGVSNRNAAKAPRPIAPGPNPPPQNVYNNQNTITDDDYSIYAEA